MPSVSGMQPTRSNASVSAEWSGTPLRDRLRWVAAFRRALASREREVTAVIEQEIGKPRWEAVTAELMPVFASCRWHEKRAGRVLAPRAIRGGGMIAMGQTQRVLRRPLGRVAIIATWNYPVGLLGVQLVQALSAGNRVTVKPSEVCPKTHGLLLEIAQQAGLPEGVLTATEPTREAGSALLREHRFDHVLFTGSTGVGRAIAETLAPSLTPSTLELSGRDSALVLADADPKLAAKSIWYMIEANAGQTCMAPKRVLVHEDAYGQFLREFGYFAGAARPRRLVSEAAAHEAFEQAEAAVAAGGRSLSGLLEPPRARAPAGSIGPEKAWLRAHAIADCPTDAVLVEGRNFGPVAAVVPCRDEDAMLAVHNACDQHLATSIYTRSPKYARERLLDRLAPVSTVTFNDCVIPTAHPAASIGGVGSSGWGTSQGAAGLLAMTRAVTVTETSPLVRPPLDAPAPNQIDRMIGWVTGLYGGKPTAESSTGLDRTGAHGGPRKPHPLPSGRGSLVEQSQT